MKFSCRGKSRLIWLPLLLLFLSFPVSADILMLAHLTYNGSAVTVTPPTGWTFLVQTSSTSGGSTSVSVVYYRIATVTDDPVTNYTFSLSSDRRFAAGITAYNGVDPTTPIGAFAGSAGSGTTLTAPSVAATTNDMIVRLFALASGGSAINTPASPNNLGYSDFTSAGPNGSSGLAAHRPALVTGATGTQTTTTTGSSTASVGQTVILKPAPSTTITFNSSASTNSGGPTGGSMVIPKPSGVVSSPGPNHYAISYPLGQQGVTCEAQAVTITAHGSATDHTNLFTPSNTTQILLTTTPAAGGWALRTGGNPGSFSNLGGGQAQYTFSGAESSVSFWLTQTTATTAPHIDIDVTGPVATDIDGDATEDAKAQFASTAFRFFADNVAEGIGPQISGKSSTVAPGNQTLQLRAVQTNTTTGACQAALTAANTPVELAFTCNNPATCHVSLPTPLTITAAATQSIAGSPNAGPLTYTSVNMNFGGTGVATFSINYADAGQITLSARKVLTATGTTTPPTTSFTLLGTSNAIKVKPAGICVESTDANSDCASGDALCSAFVKAGDGVALSSRFNLTVKGVTWESAGDTNFCSGVAGTNLTTPNFQLSNIPLTHTKIRPTGAGTQNGNLAVSTVSLVAADNGTKTITNQAISEVGVFTITATPPLYLTDQAIAASTSVNIGRFFPHRFTVTDNSPALVNICTTGATPFTYMSQPFYYGTAPILTVTALNTADGVTSNYGGGTAGVNGFWKLTSTLPRSYTNTAVAAATFADVQDVDVTLNGHTDFDGIGTLALDSSTNGDSFNYMRVSEEAPFNAAFNLTFNTGGFQDADHTLVNPVCYDPDNNGVCDTYSINGVGGALLRFGRMVIGTGFGSELLPVVVPMHAEYFDGTSFIANTDDTCTALALADHLRLSNPDTAGGAAQAGNASMTIDASNTSITVFNSPLSGGNTGTRFSAPGSGNVGFVDITGNLDCSEPTIPCVGPNTFTHLLYDWDEDGNHDNNPTGRADFGVYEGPRTHIYTREPW